MPICVLCQSLLARVLEDVDASRIPVYFRSHHILHGLKSSAEGGCDSCTVLHGQVSKCNPPPSRLIYTIGVKSQYPSPSPRRSILPGLQSESFLVTVSTAPESFVSDSSGQIEPSPSPSKHSFIQLKLWDSDLKFDIEIADEPHFLSVSPMSALRFDQAKSWLATCEAEHEICHARYDLEYIPTRLIDVGCKGITPRLIETKGRTLGDNKYFALSHCWGLWIPKHATTRKDSLQKRLGKIPLKNLPKTFNEAIKATRRLGLRYIWIDSLCIVQDSIEDWQRESALMGKVYSNCFCMLAAATSKNSHGGLFQSSQSYSILRGYQGVDTPGVLLKAATPSWEDSISDSPLSQRGWTLQERELSPRILYFMYDTIHFECRHAQAEGRMSISGLYEEYGLVPKHPSPTAPGVKRCMDPVFSREGEVLWREPASILPKSRHNTWLEMVEGYSTRTLSVPTDKFPAVSGLAAEYSYLLKDDYVAGLWRKDLIRGLSWSKPATSPKSPIIDYGPSWSWAKVSGPVTYDLLFVSETKTKLLNSPPFIQEICITPEGNDPNGTLKSAFIRMRARLIPLVWKRRTTWRIGSDIVEIIWDMQPDESISYKLLSLGRIGLVVTQNNSRRSFYTRMGIALITETEYGTWLSTSVAEDITLV